MTKFEMKYLFKYLGIMIVPAYLIFYLIELLFNYLFKESNYSSMEEIISKSITLIVIIGIVRILKKENKSFYTQEKLVSGFYLTFNAVIFLFLFICIYYGIDILFNVINGKVLFDLHNVMFLIFNIILVTIFIIINLTKNIKLLD